LDESEDETDEEVDDEYEDAEGQSGDDSEVASGPAARGAPAGGVRVVAVHSAVGQTTSSTGQPTSTTTSPGTAWTRAAGRPARQDTGPTTVTRWERSPVTGRWTCSRSWRCG